MLPPQSVFWRATGPLRINVGSNSGGKWRRHQTVHPKQSFEHDSVEAAAKAPGLGTVAIVAKSGKKEEVEE